MFWDIFFNLCIKEGTTPSAVVKELGIAAGSVTKWKNGTVPQGVTMQKIASYFNVTVDYLLGNAPAPEEEKSPAAGLNQQLAELWEQLDEAGKEEAMRYLDYLRSRRK